MTQSFHQSSSKSLGRPSRLALTIVVAVAAQSQFAGCGEALSKSEIPTGPTTSVVSSNDAEIVDDLQDTLDSLKSNYIAVRIEAIQKLGGWKVKSGSEEAKKIVKALVDFRADEYNDFEDTYVDQAFRSLDEVAVQEVKRLVDTGEDRDISTAIMVMRSLGPQWMPKFEDSIKTLFDSSDPDDVWQGIYTLEELGTSGALFVDRVAEELDSKDFQVQQIALRAIGAIGPKAEAYLPKVRKLADDGQNISVKSHAMMAMGRIAAGSPQAGEVASQLTGYLDERNFVLKQRCLTGLIALGKDAVAAKEKAKKFMETDTNGLAAQGAYLYGLTSNDWDTAADRLGVLTKDATVCFEALAFLKQAGPNAKKATEMLLVMTREEDESLSSPAVQALCSIYAAPDKDDPQFQKVAKRFVQLSTGEINEAGFIANQQLDKWVSEGFVAKEGQASKDSQNDASSDPSK